MKRRKRRPSRESCSRLALPDPPDHPLSGPCYAAPPPPWAPFTLPAPTLGLAGQSFCSSCSSWGPSAPVTHTCPWALEMGHQQPQITNQGRWVERLGHRAQKYCALGRGVWCLELGAVPLHSVHSSPKKLPWMRQVALTSLWSQLPNPKTSPAGQSLR